MNQQSMTGDPNQETHPSIFNFDSYPIQDVPPIDWTRIPMATPMPFTSQGQFNPNLQYNIQNQQGELGNFSFCTSQTPHPAQFPFPNSPQIGEVNSVMPLRCKRKTDSPPLQSCKQHITEEKMAEHMSRLHISSETASSKETDSTRTQRLYMCEEMRKLQRDSILPHSLLTKIQRPCQALVLWTPPKRLVNLDNNVSNESENEQNIDNNQMDFDV